MLDFDISFFEEEERDGFTIPSFMKHAWAAQLEMLALVDKICIENDISYFADWGTLLGAVRHKGYIPWDDDIDLCMMRSDVERFAEVVGNYEGIELSNIFNNPNHGMRANRVSNKVTFSVDRSDYKRYHGFPFSAGLDIFIIDYVPRDKKLEEEWVEATRICSGIINSREWLSTHSPMDEGYAGQVKAVRSAIRDLERICNIQFSEENPTDQEILILAEEISGLYSDEDSDYLTQIACLGVGMPYYIPKDTYRKSIRVPFENTTIPISENYDELLRLKYGDNYMTPINQGSGHDYPFYDRLIRAISEDRKHDSFEDTFNYIQNISSRYYIDFKKKTAEPLLHEEEESATYSSKVAALCELLEEFKRICNIANIPYYAINETLECAVEEDVDVFEDAYLHVAIHREDVVELLRVLPQELDPWFNCENIYTNSSYEDMRIHIWSDKYMCDEEDFAKRFHGCKEEVSMYVSVIDYVAQDEEQDEVSWGLIKNLVVTAESMPSEGAYSEDVLRIVEEWNRILSQPIDTDKNLRKEFLRAADNLCRVVESEDARGVRITEDVQKGINKIYDLSMFKGTREQPFFLTTISVPAAYDKM